MLTRLRASSAKAKLLAALFAVLALRAATLETPDLIDPTESRYAVIAQSMYLTGDWLVPRLTDGNELVPYLGKPPLHFWLTALSFEAFGMDEWVARFPSFVALTVMCFCVWRFSRLIFREEVGLLAAVILSTTGLAFFLSGASVVDVTLAACVTGAIASFAAHAFAPEGRARRWPGVLFFACLALGFMIKGPIAPALVAFPVVGWLIVSRSLGALQTLPWISGIAAMLLIIGPWFVAMESANPGFARYFFINENFRRFLVRDYGDKYGSGHVYPYASVWWMYAMGSLPWTPFVVLHAWRLRRTWLTRSAIRANPWVVYTLLWALSPAVMFTFSRQLLPTYVIPGLPGFAILAALLFVRSPESSLGRPRVALGLHLAALAALMLTPVLALSNIGPLAAGAAIVPLMILAIVSSRLWKRAAHAPTSIIAAYGLSIAALFTSGILLASGPFADRCSSERILQAIAADLRIRDPYVGVHAGTCYSARFYSGAWEEELGRPVQVTTVEDLESDPSLPDELVVRTDEIDLVLSHLPKSYSIAKQIGPWYWLSTNDLPAILPH